VIIGYSVTINRSLLSYRLSVKAGFSKLIEGVFNTILLVKVTVR